MGPFVRFLATVFVLVLGTTAFAAAPTTAARRAGAGPMPLLLRTAKIRKIPATADQLAGEEVTHIDGSKIVFVPDPDRSHGRTQGRVTIFPSRTSDEPLQFARTTRSFNEVRRTWSREGIDLLQLVRGKRVLDLYMGGSNVAEVLRRRGEDAYGLDGYLTKAQRKQPFHFLANSQRTGLPARSFDLIFETMGYFGNVVGSQSAERSAYSMLQGIGKRPDLAKNLDEIDRILRPGGRFMSLGWPRSSVINLLAQRYPTLRYEQLSRNVFVLHKLAATPADR